MTWNEITDGQPGLALPAMQNWRHAGRFNTDMVPLDNSGATLTTGLLKLGTTAAPWAELNIATGGTINVGGVPFVSGGGGSSIEVLEQKSHLEKSGINYPLSNPQMQNESFMDSAAMLITLGKDHTTTAVGIYLDRDAITISAVAQASATAWTPINTGTTATNTTAGQFVLSCSVKHAVTNATNTSYFMASSFTSFSLVDKNLKVWLYPDTVSNLTAALIRLECATTTVYCEFQIPVASITAATLNSLILNMDSPDTTTASFSRGAITRVYLGTKGSATPQTFNWSWNYLRSVDNRLLKLPIQIPCANGSTQEFLNITTATVSGDLYTLGASTTSGYGIATTKIKFKQLDISNGQGIIGSGTAGQAALTGWDIQRTFLSTNTTGDLIITSRWQLDPYRVATLTNASTTVLSITTSTVKDGFKSGNIVRLYNYQYIDQNYQSLVNASIGSNFLDLTLTADATATSSLLTLVHGNTSNQNLGGDTPSNWYGVRVSADDYYMVEAQAQAQSQALLKATTSLFLPRDQGMLYPSYVHSHWKMNQISGNEPNAKAGATYDMAQVGTVPFISGGKLQGARGQFAAANYFQWASAGSAATIYDQATFAVGGWFNTSIVGTAQCVINKWGTGSATGWQVEISTANKLGLALNNTAVITSTASVCDGLWHYFLIVVKATAGVDGIRMYIDGAQAAAAVSGTTYTLNTANLFIGIRNGATNYFQGFLDSMEYWNTVPSDWATVDTIVAQRWNSGVGKEYGNDIGFIQKSTITDVSGNKLITATRLTRQDATNQIPRIFQRNAVIS